MQINRINFTNFTPQMTKITKSETKSENEKAISQMAYNPIAYRDYNISFGARLFRSPENFYEQSFNKENMPKSMKQYLNGNYQDRQHIPPAQMMKIVFDDINYADSLDEVKELFPNEPLFKNLHTPAKKFRQGVLAEIDLMKDPNKSLFKNGKDDLGLYLLKKIYLEGKILKEINNDFKKDISVYYKGISDISYRTIADFGIGFPERPFWKSFLATREDFPYVPIKRKDAEFHASNKAKHNSSDNITPKKERKPKYNFKEYQIDKITDSINDSEGDEKKLRKNLKKRGIKDNEELSFICKYFKQIMYIVQDRMHSSEEMMQAFGDPDSMKSSQKEKFNKYWKEHPDFKDLQSMLMSDTIKLFTLTYGADGNNEEFKELIEYANSIKPEREKRKLKHDRMQAFLERTRGIFQEEKTVQLENKKAEKTDEDIESKWRKKNNTKDYTLISPSGEKYIFSLNIKDNVKKILSSTMCVGLPNSYINKYISFFLRQSEATDLFKISFIIHSSDSMKENMKNVLMEKEETAEISKKINKRFIEKYNEESETLSEVIYESILSNDSEFKDLYGLSPFVLVNIIAEVAKDKPEKAEKLKRIITEKYNEYMEPITNEEITEISKTVMKNISTYNNKDEYGNIKTDDISVYLKALSIYYNNASDRNKKKLRSEIKYSIEKNFGRAAKSVINPYFSDNSKRIITDRYIAIWINESPDKFTKLILSDEESRDYVRRYLSK